MKQFLTALLLMFLVAAAACSSTGDPESELLFGTSLVPAEQQPSGEQSDGTDQQPAGTADASGQSVPTTAPPAVTVPTGIPELPEVLWPTRDDPSPTAVDALKDYLIGHLYEPGWNLGYRIIFGCAGVEANSNVMCSREPRVSEEGDLQVYTYAVGPAPPEAAFYSIGVQGSVTEGWWIFWANPIAR